MTLSSEWVCVNGDADAFEETAAILRERFAHPDAATLKFQEVQDENEYLYCVLDPDYTVFMARQSTWLWLYSYSQSGAKPADMNGQSRVKDLTEQGGKCEVASAYAVDDWTIGGRPAQAVWCEFADQDPPRFEYHAEALDGDRYLYFQFRTVDPTLQPEFAAIAGSLELSEKPYAAVDVDEATPTPAPVVVGGDTAKTHPGGVVLPNGWVQYTSEIYGGTTIAVPADWWCIDYDPADQGKTVDAISAAANDQFGILKTLLGLPSPDHLFYCLADLDRFMSQQESGIKVFLGRQQGFTRAIDMLKEIDRTQWQVSELALPGYDAASYEGFDARTQRYERITVLLLTPPRILNMQSYSQSESRLADAEAIEQAIVIKLK